MNKLKFIINELKKDIKMGNEINLLFLEKN